MMVFPVRLLVDSEKGCSEISKKCPPGGREHTEKQANSLN
jgi:hypothetical protein